MLEEGPVGLDCGMRAECEDSFVDLVKKIETEKDYYQVENICFRDPKHTTPGNYF